MAQGVKRETGQQLRELQVDHGAAMRQLAAMQEASERAQVKLQAGTHYMHSLGARHTQHLWKGEDVILVVGDGDHV
jgi:hypothetical protein